jgi:hypothetical protein
VPAESLAAGSARSPEGQSGLAPGPDHDLVDANVGRTKRDLGVKRARELRVNPGQGEREATPRGTHLVGPMNDGRRFGAISRVPLKQGHARPLLAEREKRETHTARWGAAQIAVEKTRESGSSTGMSGKRQGTSEIERR